MNLEALAPGLPVTVTAAIILFIAKESLELYRRYNSDVRKGKALRTLLARECELNYWTYKILLKTANVIAEDFEEGTAANYKIRRSSSGQEIFLHDLGSVSSGSWPLPPAHCEFMRDVLLDVANLEKPFLKTYNLLLMHAKKCSMCMIVL